VTEAKLQLLLRRAAGEEWIESGLCHLDDPDVERADVSRGLRTYRSLGRAYERRFQQLQAALPRAVPGTLAIERRLTRPAPPIRFPLETFSAAPQAHTKETR
jgi:hypothetical protein